MVKISMMPLRGLLFGVRLNARLGFTGCVAFYRPTQLGKVAAGGSNLTAA
jgi:hypothetical protein